MPEPNSSDLMLYAEAGVSHTRISRAEFSPDKKYVVTTGANSDAIVWDTITGREITRVVVGGDGRGADLIRFSKSGKLLVLSNSTTSTTVFHVPTGKSISLSPKVSASQVSFSDDEQTMLIVPFFEDRFQLWRLPENFDSGSVQIVQEINFKNRTYPSVCGAFYLEGSPTVLVTEESPKWFNSDRLLVLYSMDGSRRVLRKTEDHFLRCSIAIDETNSRMALVKNPTSMGNEEPKVELIDMKSWATRWENIASFKAEVEEIKYDPQESQFGYVTRDQKVGVVLDALSGTVRSLKRASGEETIISYSNGVFFLNNLQKGLTGVQANSGEVKFRSPLVLAGRVFSAISPNGRYILTRNGDDLSVFDLTQMGYIYTEQDSGNAAIAAFSEDGSHVALLGTISTSVREFPTMKMKHGPKTDIKIAPETGLFSEGDWSVAVSNDSNRLMVGEGTLGRFSIYDLSTGVSERGSSGPQNPFNMYAVTDGTKVTISGDGIRALASGGGGIFGEVSIWWPLGSSKPIVRRDENISSTLTFVPRSHDVLAYLNVGPSSQPWITKELFRVSLDNSVRRTKFNSDQKAPELRHAVSNSERNILLGMRDGLVSTWDIGTGAKINNFDVGRGYPTGIGLSRDGYIVFDRTGGSYEFWDFDRGSLLGTLVLLGAKQWVFAGSDGRFEASGVDDLKGVHWVAKDRPLAPLAVETYFRDFYEPRLLNRLVSCGKAENCGIMFPPVRTLSLSPGRRLVDLNRVQPKVAKPVTMFDVSSGAAIVTVGIAGGVDQSQESERQETAPYDLRLFRNGQLVGQWPEPKASASGPQDLQAWRKASLVPMEPGQTMAEHTFRVALPSKDRGKPVVFTAYAFNEDRVKSETARNDEFKVPEDMPLREPRAYVITVGVNSYELKSRDLSFAAKDARDLGAALARIKDHEVVRLTLVSEDAGPGVAAKRQATKAIIRGVLELLAGKSEAERARLKGVPGIDAKAVEQLRKATPDDVVVIAFSGHGYTDPASGQFYLLPSDSGKEAGFGPEVLSRFVSSEELSHWLREVDAGQMAMIIDACHSASAVDQPGFKPGPMGDRGLGQLAYDKGMMILAATQAADVALEVQKVKQGLLTYALVAEGFKQDEDKPARRNADIDRDGAISLREWLQYGERRVPGLYEDIRAGKVQAVHKDPRPDSNDTTARKAQTPSLFDFQSRKSLTVIDQ